MGFQDSTASDTAFYKAKGQGSQACYVSNETFNDAKDMKLKLPSLLLLNLALPLPLFAAQGATIYGVLDIGVVSGFGNHIAADAANPDLRHNWGNGNGSGIRQNYTSRLGFIATEALDGGNSVEVRFEGTLDKDHHFYFDRHAYIAVSGSFGSVRAGRTRDLINGAANRVDPFNNDGLVQDKILLAQQAGIGLFRISNSITWVSPTANGFTGTLQYGLNSTPTGNNAIKLLLTYDNGPFGMHAGIDRPSRSASADGSFKLGPNAHNLVLGSFYDFGSFKLAGVLLHATRDMDSAEVTTTLPKQDGNRLGWITSLRVPTAHGEAKMVLVKSDMVFNKYGVQQPIREIGFGYEHNLSKQTFLYLQLGLERHSNGGHWHSGMLTRF